MFCTRLLGLRPSVSLGGWSTGTALVRALARSPISFGDKDAQLAGFFEGCREWRGEGVTKYYGLPAYFKDERPSLDEDASYLLGWLAGYFAADGCVAEDGDAILNSARIDDLEYVRTLCTRLGIGTFGVAKQNRVGIDGVPSDIYNVRFMTKGLPESFFLLDQHLERYLLNEKKYERKRWVVQSVEWSDRVEEVFCAEVPGTHAFTLEDNILTGNCFGCGEGGDVISFIQKIDHLSFSEAVELLAGRAKAEPHDRFDLHQVDVPWAPPVPWRCRAAGTTMLVQTE